MSKTPQDEYVRGPRNGKRPGYVVWKGEKKTLATWANEIGISMDGFRLRLKKWGVCERSMAPLGDHRLGNMNRIGKKASKPIEAPKHAMDAFLYGRRGVL